MMSEALSTERDDEVNCADVNGSIEAVVPEVPAFLLSSAATEEKALKATTVAVAQDVNLSVLAKR
jgi:hypothetical protein